MTACAGRLYAVTCDDGLTVRELCAQNLTWRRFGGAGGIVALAAPREAVAGGPLGLYGLTQEGRLLYREADTRPGPWTEVGKAPTGSVTLATANAHLYAVDDHGAMWTAPLGGTDQAWEYFGPAPGVRSLAGLSGRLYALDQDGRVATRTTAPDDTWCAIGPAEPGATVLAAGSGWLVTASADGLLHRRAPVTEGPER
jgi:hypothetical protein